MSNIYSSTPTVSVVMVAYNSSKYIDEAIRGIVAQRCPFGVQLVICDDASTDNTAQIVETWAQRYPHIIEFHRNAVNLGVQGNYLKALSLCRGKYIAMCDADDYWCSSSKLTRQVRYMESHPECALTYHTVINYYEASGEKSLSNGHGMVARTPQELAAGNTVTNLSVLYRASLIDLHHLPAWLNDVRLIDYALHMLFASRGDIHFMRRPMGVYRHLPTAIWSEAEQSKRREMAIDVRRHLIAELADRPDLTGPLQRAIEAMKAAAAKNTTMRRPLISRIRAAVSRMIPRPRP